MIKFIIGGATLIVFVIGLLFIISTAAEQFEKASNTLRREDEDE
jgi:hypothetical protein